MRGERLLNALGMLEKMAYKTIDFPLALGALFTFSIQLSTGEEAIRGFRETMEH